MLWYQLLAHIVVLVIVAFMVGIDHVNGFFTFPKAQTNDNKNNNNNKDSNHMNNDLNSNKIADVDSNDMYFDDNDADMYYYEDSEISPTSNLINNDLSIISLPLILSPRKPPPSYLDPILTDDFVNITSFSFSCKPSEMLRLKREEQRKALRKKRESNDEAVIKLNSIQNKIHRRLSKKEKDEVFVDLLGNGGNENMDPNDPNYKSGGLSGMFFFGLNASETNFSSFNSTEEMLNASLSNEMHNKNKKGKIKLSFRQARELRLKHKLNENIQLEAKLLTYDLGPPCEGLVCGSCKIIVEEIIHRVSERLIIETDSSDDEIAKKVQFQTIDDIIEYENICESEKFDEQYKPMVKFLCREYLLNVTAPYYNISMSILETVDDWRESTMSRGTLDSIKNQVCLGTGACDETHFDRKLYPLEMREEKWNDGCFACRAFATEIEQHVALRRYVNDRVLTDIITHACDKVNLPFRHDFLCRNIYKDKKHMMKLLWSLNVFAENFGKQPKAERPFIETLCQQADQCIATPGSEPNRRSK